MLQRLQDFYILFYRNALSLSMLQRLQDFYTLFCRNAMSLSILQRLQDFYTLFCRNADFLKFIGPSGQKITRNGNTVKYAGPGV